MEIKKWIFGGLILTVTGIAPLASASVSVANSVMNTVKIEELNKQIQMKGVQWKAKATWVSELSRSELKRVLGSNVLPTSTLDYSSESKNSSSPSALDWRNQNGVNWLGPVLNQGNCGSCVAFASVGTLEAQVSIASGLPWLHPVFSSQQLFACGGGGCDTGWRPDSAANFLQGEGVVDSACAPYTMGSNGIDMSCSETTAGCGDAESRKYKISGYRNPSGGGFFTHGYSSRDIENVKEALTHGPLMTTLAVHTDFLTYSSGIYKTVVNKVEGGHAVSIVGYNSQERYWIIRNSWGNNWGEQGFARVSWDDPSGVGADTWQLKVPNKNEYILVKSPVENQYMSGDSSISVGNTSNGNINVEIRKTGIAKVINAFSCVKSDSNECKAKVDTRNLEDGRYELIAKSENSNGFSEVRSFYSVNHAPQNMSIHFMGAQGFDLSKPQKARIQFDITTQTTSVPFANLTMILQDKAGKVVTSRTTDIVLGSMRLGFRTNTVPNGNYNLFFRGTLPIAGQVLTLDSNVIPVRFQN